MNSEPLSKDTLRHEAIRHRERIDPASENPDDACALFFDHIRPAAGQVVALYWPKGREIDCRPIIERLLKEGFTCALPVVGKGEKTLGFAAWDETVPLTDGPFGIKQPAGEAKWVEPDIVVVPMLAFDRRGYRLGYGGGYYDATLRALRDKKGILAVGLAWAQQAVLFSLPVEPHDEKLDWIITPLQAHRYTEIK